MKWLNYIRGHCSNQGYWLSVFFPAWLFAIFVIIIIIIELINENKNKLIPKKSLKKTLNDSVDLIAAQYKIHIIIRYEFDSMIISYTYCLNECFRRRRRRKKTVYRLSIISDFISFSCIHSFNIKENKWLWMTASIDFFFFLDEWNDWS